MVCRQLGYSKATAALESSWFGSGTGPILFSELSCIGNEKYITECDHRVNNCSHNEDAGVMCEGQSVCRSVCSVFAGKCTCCAYV